MKLGFDGCYGFSLYIIVGFLVMVMLWKYLLWEGEVVDVLVDGVLLFVIYVGCGYYGLVIY